MHPPDPRPPKPDPYLSTDWRKYQSFRETIMKRHTTLIVVIGFYTLLLCACAGADSVKTPLAPDSIGGMDIELTEFFIQRWARGEALEIPCRQLAELAHRTGGGKIL